MGFRFRRSVKIAPGVRLNVGKKSASVSFGVRGARHTISTTGRRTSSVGIPGTGLYYTTSSSMKNKQSSYNNYSNDDAYVEVENFNNFIKQITSLHKECDYNYNWNKIAMEAAPFNPSQKGPNEIRALEKLAKYKPGILEKIFKGLGKKKENELQKNIELAKVKDKELYQEWQRKHRLSKLVLAGNLDSYKTVINEVNIFNNIKDLISAFKFKVINKDLMTIEYKIDLEATVPKKYPTVTKTGKLSVRNYTKTAYYEIVKLLVSGSIWRTARNIFGLLPLSTVIIHIETDKLNTQTGNIETYTLLSVEIERDIMDKLNFDLIDPFDALNNFKYNGKFLKTKGFQPVDKIEKLVQS